jgi:hypothetical protein
MAEYMLSPEVLLLEYHLSRKRRRGFLHKFAENNFIAR